MKVDEDTYLRGVWQGLKRTVKGCMVPGTYRLKSKGQRIYLLTQLRSHEKELPSKQYLPDAIKLRNQGG